MNEIEWHSLPKLSEKEKQFLKDVKFLKDLLYKIFYVPKEMFKQKGKR